MVHTERMSGLIREVRDDGFLTEGHFKFRSGMHSLVLLDRDRLLSDTQLASRMGYAIAKHYFLSRADVVATPSVWGAGLAQWVGYFLEPRQPVVYPTGGLDFSDVARGQIQGKRVLIIDNLVLSGKTVQEFVQAVARAEGRPLGVGALADFSGIEFPIPVFGLLNDSLGIYNPDDCPACKAGEPLTEVGY